MLKAGQTDFWVSCAPETGDQTMNKLYIGLGKNSAWRDQTVAEGEDLGRGHSASDSKI